MTSFDRPLPEQPRKAEGFSPVEHRTQPGFDYHDCRETRLEADSLIRRGTGVT